MLFRDHFDAALVQRYADQLHALATRGLCVPWTAEDVTALSNALPPLEMKARVTAIADALERALVSSSSEACCAFAVACTEGDPPWSGFEVWPATLLVERHGPHAIDAGLDALEVLTQRFTGEFAIRPLLLHDPDAVFARLTQWTKHPNEHVRRLVSEGTRTRLPWGIQVPSLIEDPTPQWPLLESLLDDSSTYVRRSVSNALNDLSRDHPDAVLSRCERWLKDASTERYRTLRHALRSRIKSGCPRALAMLALGTMDVEIRDFRLSASTCVIGDTLVWEADLVATGSDAGTAVVDVVVTYARPSGRTSTRVFKGAELSLQSGEHRTLRRKLSMRDVSVRKHHPGEHTLTLQVNGEPAAERSFTLRAP